MFQKFINHPEIKSLKYFIAFMLVCVCLYAYAGVAGWKYTGAPTEKWSPEGRSNHYHK